MLELEIFVILFVFTTLVALVSSAGWLISSERNEKLTIELSKANREIYSLKAENKKQMAEVSFYRLQLEEKEDVQESEENINA